MTFNNTVIKEKEDSSKNHMFFRRSNDSLFDAQIHDQIHETSKMFDCYRYKNSNFLISKKEILKHEYLKPFCSEINRPGNDFDSRTQRNALASASKEGSSMLGLNTARPVLRNLKVSDMPVWFEQAPLPDSPSRHNLSQTKRKKKTALSRCSRGYIPDLPGGIVMIFSLKN